jgi:hypothetical protein
LGKVAKMGVDKQSILFSLVELKSKVKRAREGTERWSIFLSEFRRKQQCRRG